jgi:hypothetical protein
MRKFLLGIGTILCLIAFFAFGLKTRMTSKADAKPATKIAAQSAPSASSALATTKSAATAAIAPIPGTKPTAKSTQSAVVLQQYAKLPLSFEPNLGQAKGDTKFLARGDGYSLFLTSDEAVLAMKGHSTKSAKSATSTNAMGVLRMKLDGSNPAPNFSAQNELPGKSNYFIGTQENWHSNVPNYGKVEEKNVYAGIDLVYYGSQRQLEYDFNVAPGTDPKTIQITFDGARKLKVDAAGNLILSLAGGDVKFEKPFAYQMKGDQKEPVAARFHLGDRKYRVYFAIGDYDAKRPLVIDPILSYSTYLGGSDIDGANAIAVAPDNTAFVAGGTFSSNFPIAHALQPNDGGSLDFPQDAFVTKISADGSTLLYSTYLGGKNQDSANGIAVDAAGAAYVVGTTLSPDFPVTPGQSFDTLCGGDGKCGATFNSQALIVSNGFLAKINAAGSGIVYSGFIGEFEDTTANAVAVDGNENAYVTGQVGPNGFASNGIGTPLSLNILPAPAGAISNGDGTSTIFLSSSTLIPINSQVSISGVGATPANPNPPSPFDGVFTVISSAPGSIVINAAGGPASGAGTVVVNPAPPFPISNNAFQKQHGGGSTDAYVVKVASTGTAFLYSTYIGGESEDSGNGIAVDKNNHAYVTGLTFSLLFPTTASAFQPANGGNGDAFFSEVDTLGGGLTYSTFLGGSQLDQGNAITIDGFGDAFIAGGSSSTGLGTPGAVQPNCTLDAQGNCEGDAFVAEINPSLTGAASELLFTYLGGSLADSASGIALDTGGNIYVTGSTVSQDFPIAAAAFQGTYGGGNDDAFVTKMNPTGSALVFSSYLGGTQTDNGNGIAVDTSGSAYVAGQTCSTNFPVSNPVQAAPGGNCDAFVSKVSILNGIQLNPSALTFTAQSLNTTSAPLTVTLTNGDNPLTISNITLGGADASAFAISSSSTCVAPSSLNPGAKCTIIATFTPTTPGVSNATITITDSAPGSPQVINLTGTASTLTLSASSLDFGSVAVGSTSAAQSITATNDGTTAISFSSITASGDFAETDNCVTVPLQPSTNCTINVTFKPSSTNSSVGALTITDNAPGSPQIVLLTGTGFVQTSDFTIGAVTPSASITAGGTASYSVVLTSVAGFNQPLNMSCTGLPKEVSCSFSANPVTPTAAGTVVTVGISTAERTMLPPVGQIRVTPPSLAIRSMNLLWATCLLILLMFGAITAGTQRGRRAAATLVFAAGLILFSVACNGGGSTGAEAGTPAGTYTINIVASSADGTITHSTPVTLQVK